jgi:glycosyltransferase involved in cell wall biosynthesis
MKVALVHDVLNQLGGAEKVLENFLEIWPDAVIHTVFYDEQKTFGKFAKFQKKISWLDKFPFAHKHPRLFLIALPFAFSAFNFDEYDVVISDSSAFAKFVRPKNKLHISYIHTPTRFLWTEPEYLDRQQYPFILKFLGKLVLPMLRNWDYQAARGPQFLIANSQNVRNRIQKYYKRESQVIPPPIDAHYFSVNAPASKQDYFFTVSRLEPYKRIDVMVQAFNELGLPLKIAGTGTEEKNLKALAKTNIEFLGRISDEELRKRYSECQAFLFAAEEDAGMTILEAQATGTPVIAYKAGGALEVIKEGETGMFFEQQTPAAIINAVKNFKASQFDPQKLRDHAMQYDKQIFQEKIKDFVASKLR